ncbi:hypothetical protein A3K62_01465 [Candidatus Pacearchaeota archaeon RBG_16_35_8]|nr:MAG: hypothetical protein A3K62_01465 [Candidatus Pacearchaeota archaeon RBG_16_35_8]
MAEKKNSLEEKVRKEEEKKYFEGVRAAAREIILYRITREGKVPDLLKQIYQDGLRFAMDNKYLTKTYEVTEEGEAWALGK